MLFRRQRGLSARLLTRTGKYEHITPILKVLHWIPVVQRIKSKILVLTFKALNGTAPKLNDLLIPYQPNRILGPNPRHLIKILLIAVPSYNLEKYGRRASCVAAPILWKTFLFRHIRIL